MENRNIQHIIEQLEDELTNDKPSFEFYCFEAGEDENDSYIQTNKQGIIRFTIRLLENADSLPEDGENFVKFDCQELTSGGDYRIKYVKVYPKKVEESEIYSQHEKWTDKLWGCLGISILIGVVVCLLWGAVSILKAIVNILF